MTLRIEDYGFISDTRTSALVGNNGSIDWLCLPRFDSDPCFAALLGDEENGRWLIGPKGGLKRTTRCYIEDSLILETTFETEDGIVTLTDFMPNHGADDSRVDLCRVVRGIQGRVELELDLVIRFDFGATKPWVRRRDYGISAIAGPNALEVRSPVRLHGEDFHTKASFTVREGECVSFSMGWHLSHLDAPVALDIEQELATTIDWWEEWASQCEIPARYGAEATRSVAVLKGLTFAPTGGIVAAATTSLPEFIGGPRNWDYRFCWLRDATFTLYSLLVSGFEAEAEAWRAWLLRAVAGDPADLQIMYGIEGERRLTEIEIPYLAGYEGSRPVRSGNAASRQFQLDIYGEVMDVLHTAHRMGIDYDENVWAVEIQLMKFLKDSWRKPDEGIWETRGGERHFTHSKIMSWVAFDRAIKAVEMAGLKGPVDEWRAIREEIHTEVCEKGFNSKRNTFVQSYGESHLDAALLLIPSVGFLPATDPRVVGTVEAIQRELSQDGLVMRYATESGVDGLPPGEGAFLPCSFWLVDDLAMMGRRDEATALFEKLLGLRNDLGLLSEQYDPLNKRQLGNFPQAFSHVGLINSAHNLATDNGPARHRSHS